MRKPPLYRLPAFGRMTFRAIVLRTLALYALAITLLAGLLTQHVAHGFGYDPGLEPVLYAGPLAPSSIVLALAAGAVGVALVLVFLPVRIFALPLGLAAVLGAALSQGPLYVPTNLFLWAYRYRALPEYESIFSPLIRIWVAGAAIAGAVVLVYVAIRSRGFRERPDVHGSARWASSSDLRKAGLLGDGGLLLGLWRDRGRLRYLRHDGPEHVFVFAPTRTGKGVGLVLPNLLTWPHSVLVHDIKGENWALSAGWRAKELGSRCLRFDPTDTTGKAAHYNPLLEIRRGKFDVRDAQTVADILVDPNGDRQRDHWDRTAHSLLTALILHVLYAEDDKTLRGCANVLTDPARPITETLEDVLATKHDPEGRYGWKTPSKLEPTKTHPVVASATRALLDRSENERSGILSTALTFLDLYRDPIIAENTADSTFRLDDLMNHERPLSLYLSVPSSDLSRTRPLVRMILNQVCRRLTETLEFADGAPVAHYRHPLLLMLDEFPALGRLNFFAESLAYLAGYGVRAFLITQDLSQHYGVYGREESITGNCHLRIAFAPNKPETAELLSKMAGVMTVHMEKRTYRGSRFDLLTNQQYISTSETQRQLLTADEAMRLPPDDLLLFAAGYPPVRATKIRYFEDQILARRARIPPQ